MSRNRAATVQCWNEPIWKLIGNGKRALPRDGKIKTILRRKKSAMLFQSCLMVGECRAADDLLFQGILCSLAGDNPSENFELDFTESCRTTIFWVNAPVRPREGEPQQRVVSEFC